jgi:intracellular sulfur oxidation DsrE/DsrF family protein
VQTVSDALQAIVQILARRAAAMSDFIEIGPLALSVERLAAILAIWLFLASAVWAGRPGRVPTASWIAVGAGILAARLSYVATNVDAFRIEPLSAAYGASNPNIALIEALTKAGIEVHVCGQALASQRIAQADVLSDVTIDFSALVTLTTLQLKGWSVVAD